MHLPTIFPCRLRSRCAHVGAGAITETLLAMQEGRAQATSQDTAAASSTHPHAQKLPKSLARWPADTPLPAASLHNRVRACGQRMGLHAAVQGTKHSIIIRGLMRHAAACIECAQPGPAAQGVPACSFPQAQAPGARRPHLPQSLQAVPAATQPVGTLVHDKGSKTLWVSASDDWLCISEADLKSKPAMPLHVLANSLGLASQGAPRLEGGRLVGPVAQLVTE